MTDRGRVGMLNYRIRESIARWCAYRLPRSVVYFAAIRLGAAATTGKWSSQVVPELRFMDAIGRWEKPDVP